MCEVDFGDMEMCEVWREKKQRARKPYRCDTCFSLIKIGDKYGNQFSIFEGEAFTERLCLACFYARRAFAKEHDGFHPSAPELSNYLSECVDDAEGRERRKWQRLLNGILNRASASRREVTP